MIETLRHREAFEYYYSLGDKRTYKLVSVKFAVSDISVGKWSRAFNWIQKVQERDYKNAEALAKKTDKLVLKTRADYRKEIHDNLLIVRVAMATAVQGLKGNSIKAETVADIDRLVGAMEKLTKLDLLLLGELDPDSGETVRMVRFAFEPPSWPQPNDTAGQTVPTEAIQQDNGNPKKTNTSEIK